MIGPESFVKTSFFVLFLICSSVINPGNTAKKCPDNPVGATSSISGIVVGTLVKGEILTNGIFSYFYYLTENTANQVISQASRLEEYATSKVTKLYDFSMNLLSGVTNQFIALFSGSGGAINAVMDTVIDFENQIQALVYGKIAGLKNSVISGTIHDTVIKSVTDPLKSVINGTVILKNLVVSIKDSIIGGNGVEGLISKITTIGGAPFKATKELVENSLQVVSDSTSETINKLKDFLQDLKSASIGKKLSDILLSPIGATKQIWKFTADFSSSIKGSISGGLRDVFEPIIGADSTDQFGRLVSIPMDLTKGGWNAFKTIWYKVEGTLFSVLGEGDLNTQISNLLNKPFVLVNKGLKRIKFILKDLTSGNLSGTISQIANAPSKIFSELFSSVSVDGSLSISLKKLVNGPLSVLKNAWKSSGDIIKGITSTVTGGSVSGIIKQPVELLMNVTKTLTKPINNIVGGDFVGKIEGLIKSPFQLVKNTVNSITGGDAIGKLKGIIKSPLQFVSQISSSIFGGDLVGKLEGLVKSPFQYLGKISSSITGGNLIGKLEGIVTSPIQSITQVLNSTTGGGVVGKLEGLIKSPFTIISQTLNSITGGDAVGKLEGIVKAPFEYIGKTLNSITGGDAMGKLVGIIKAPFDFITRTLNSITGGDAMGKLVGIIKAPFDFTTKTLNSITGGDAIGKLEGLIKSPFQFIGLITNSITGGDAIAKLEGILKAPLQFAGRILGMIPGFGGSFSSSGSVSLGKSGGSDASLKVNGKAKSNGGSGGVKFSIN